MVVVFKKPEVYTVKEHVENIMIQKEEQEASC